MRRCKIQLILIIFGFHICKCTYMLKLICNSQTKSVLSWSFADMYMLTAAKKSNSPTCMLPAETEQDDTLTFCFHSDSINKSFSLSI